MTRPDEKPFLDIKILGRVTASVRGKPVELAPKTRLVLVALVKNARITANDLNAWIYDGDPDDTRMAYEYVDELKRRLRAADPRAGELIPDNRDRKGYRLGDPASVTADVWRFRELLERADAARGDDAEFVRLSRAALAEWEAGAEPLEGLGTRPVNDYRDLLVEARTTALIACVEAEFRLGRHARLVPELRELAQGTDPDERISGLLMRALHSSGRTGEAVKVHARTRDQLSEWGVTETPELDELLGRITTPGVLVKAHQESDMADDEQETAEQQAVPTVEKVGALATGTFGTAIGTQWNVTGRVYHADGDMKIADTEADEP